jgi:hypothetical protein
MAEDLDDYRRIFDGSSCPEKIFMLKTSYTRLSKLSPTGS